MRATDSDDGVGWRPVTAATRGPPHARVAFDVARMSGKMRGFVDDIDLCYMRAVQPGWRAQQKFTGDAVVAGFGVPRVGEDDAPWAWRTFTATARPQARR
jgi:hypothetical protein